MKRKNTCINYCFVLECSFKATYKGKILIIKTQKIYTNINSEKECTETVIIFSGIKELGYE